MALGTILVADRDRIPCHLSSFQKEKKTTEGICLRVPHTCYATGRLVLVLNLRSTGREFSAASTSSAKSASIDESLQYFLRQREDRGSNPGSAIRMQ